MYPQQCQMQQNSGGKGSTLPEYLEQTEGEALIRSSPNPQAALFMLTQWRSLGVARYNEASYRASLR